MIKRTMIKRTTIKRTTNNQNAYETQLIMKKSGTMLEHNPARLST